MIVFRSLFPYWGLTGSATSRLDTMDFGPSDLKVLIGLTIGGLIPYLLPAIPAGFVKWWLFVSILDTILLTRWPRLSDYKASSFAV